MDENFYPRTTTPPNVVPLHRYGGDMLAPFKMLGQFREIDEQGEPATGIHYGILEWDPSENVKRLTLFCGDENTIEEILEEREEKSKAVCLQGVSIQNLDDRKMGSTRYTLDAFPTNVNFTSGMSAGYGHAAKQYQINGIWSGSTSINLYSARYTQMGFSFKGLEKWLRHIPEIKLRGFGTKSRHIDTFEMDILRDMHIPNVGRLRLLCGHKNYGDLHFDQTLRMDHQWQIDFNSPKDYLQCREIIRTIWECIDIAIGAVVPLEYVILTRGDKDIEQPERFSVRISHTTADNEGSQAAEVLGYMREYIPFHSISDAFWKKWMKAALDNNDKEFSNYVSLITECYRTNRMPQQYEVLTLISAIESLVKRMCPEFTGNRFPKKHLEEIVAQWTPRIFPEGILDIKVEGQQRLLNWVIRNRNTKIAHMGVPDSVSSYSLPAGIYVERVLRLLALSLLMLEYKLLRSSDIRKFFWEGYRTKDELRITPEKFVSASIYADGG